MRDAETWDEFVKHVLDRYTAAELVELLGLNTADIVGAFSELIEESRDLREDLYGYED